MPTIPRLTLWYSDRDGNERQTNVSFPSLSSVAQSVTIANEVASRISALSNARLIRAQWTLTVSPSITTSANSQTNIYERLVILFTDGITVASYSLPAPAVLDYDTSGPLRGVRVSPGTHPTALAIEQLQAALASTVLADGSPFPVGTWVAGRTVNQ